MARPRILTGIRSINDVDPQAVYYDAVVGTSGAADYTTVKAAVDAGKKRILVTANVTEAASTTLTVSTEIDLLAGVTIAMGAFRFILSAEVTVKVRGQAGSLISWGYGSALQLFDVGAFTDSIIAIDGVNLTNTSSVANCYLTAGYMELRNLKLTLPNQSNCGIRGLQSGSGGRNNIVENIHLTGGGAACTLGIDLSKGFLSGILLTGTFLTTAGNYVIQMGGEVMAWGLDIGSNNIKAAGNVSDVNVSGGTGTIEVAADTKIEKSRCSVMKILGTGVYIYSSEIGSLTHDTGIGQALLAECRITGTSYTVDGVDNKFENCVFSDNIGTVTVPSGVEHAHFADCTFAGDVVVNGNYTRIGGCRVGETAGGGAQVITVGAGTTFVNVFDTFVDNAIVDNSAGGLTQSNVQVY